MVSNIFTDYFSFGLVFRFKQANKLNLLITFCIIVNVFFITQNFLVNLHTFFTKLTWQNIFKVPFVIILFSAKLLLFFISLT